MDERIDSHHTDIISQVAQYIFDHSEQAISLDQLADFTGFSKYHFNRLFFAATGYQLGEYIQRQKLEKSLHLLSQGHRSIIDVALSIGYDSPSSFSRAFKKHFDVTPSEVQQGKRPFNERAGILQPKKSDADRNLQPHWCQLEDRKIYGLYGQGFSGQSFSALAGKLYGQLGDIAKPMPFEALEVIGVSIENPWVGEQSQSEFFAGFAHGLEAHQENLQCFEWVSGDWARFSHHGSHSTMWQTISKIYAQWVLPYTVKLKDQQIVQHYLNNPNKTPPEELETHLYFAVDKTLSGDGLS